MRRVIRNGSAKAGLPPGTLVHIGDRKADETKIRVMTYDEQHVWEQAPQFEFDHIVADAEAETPTVHTINQGTLPILDDV